MAIYRTNELFDFSKTLAGDYLKGFEWPWEALESISAYISELGPRLPKSKFVQRSSCIWIAKSAVLAPSASIKGPCIIDEGAEIRHCAFIRGSCIIGKNAVVGNSTEIKNSILSDDVQVPHFNYIGDSILGYKAHLGAGAVTSNVKSDKSLVVVKAGNEEAATGRKKVGAMLGDFAEIGCNSVLCPGCVVGRNSNVYPTSCVRGTVPPNCIYKGPGKIVEKA